MYKILICVLCFVLGPEEGSQLIQVPALEKLMAVSVSVPLALFYILPMVSCICNIFCYFEFDILF